MLNERWTVYYKLTVHNSIHNRVSFHISNAEIFWWCRIEISCLVSQLEINWLD